MFSPPLLTFRLGLKGLESKSHFWARDGLVPSLCNFPTKIFLPSFRVFNMRVPAFNVTRWPTYRSPLSYTFFCLKFLAPLRAPCILAPPHQIFLFGSLFFFEPPFPRLAGQPMVIFFGMTDIPHRPFAVGSVFWPPGAAFLRSSKNSPRKSPTFPPEPNRPFFV